MLNECASETSDNFVRIHHYARAVTLLLYYGAFTFFPCVYVIVFYRVDDDIKSRNLQWLVCEIIVIVPSSCFFVILRVIVKNYFCVQFYSMYLLVHVDNSYISKLRDENASANTATMKPHGKAFHSIPGDAYLSN